MRYGGLRGMYPVALVEEESFGGGEELGVHFAL